MSLSRLYPTFSVLYKSLGFVVFVGSVGSVLSLGSVGVSHLIREKIKEDQV